MRRTEKSGCGARINPRKLAEDVAEHLREKEPERGPVPTLDEFIPRYMREHVQANRHKPRGMEAKESIFRRHLSPRFGGKQMDSITDEQIQEMKADLSERRPKTVNNILTALNKLLKTAVRWRVLKEMPVTVDFLKVESDEVAFYDFVQYRRLVKAAAGLDARTLAVVLLGGDAGLRRNEMIALAPADISLTRRTITVRNQSWRGKLIPTKGNAVRVVPMTRMLADSMREMMRKDGARVLVNDEGGPATIQSLRTWASWAQRAASLPASGALHILRHTFCSHLAMRGATLLAIRELAGHKSMRTTLRYMHLCPSERTRAIALLDSGRNGRQKDNQGSH